MDYLRRLAIAAAVCAAGGCAAPRHFDDAELIERRFELDLGEGRK